ncbi:MAG TPA: hypothetical protein VLD85_12635 [Anaeromyxobacteraceae bacterium]|nr:hypothetical protein [Anaeromyxobacteraceae bacterium]
MKLALAVTATLLAACGGRAHFEPAYGRSTRAQFAAQREPPGARPAKAATGLDAQEASIIASNYRRSLSPKEAQQQTKAEPVLVVAPQQQGGLRAMLPLPSVPKE